MTFMEYVKRQKYYWYDTKDFVEVKFGSLEFSYDLVYKFSDTYTYNVFKNIINNNHIDFVELPNKTLCFDSCNPKYLKYLSDYQFTGYNLEQLQVEYKICFK